MILCFSGTGNSRYVADALADRLSDRVISLNSVLKNGEPHTFLSEKPFVLVAPVYAWRLPRVVEDILKDAELSGNQKVYIVVTMGGESGNCYEYCRNIMHGRKEEFMGFQGVVMPDNYLAMFPLPDEETVTRILHDAILVIDEIANAIRSGNRLYHAEKKHFGKVLSGPVNSFFYRFAVTDKKFTVSDSCCGCGTCRNLCPVNNITLENNRPVFSGKCISCLSCIHHCPKEAINIKGRTENRKRYVCPPYKRD